VNAQVHEDLVATEVLHEAVAKSSGVPGAVVLAVRDENPAHDVSGYDFDNAGLVNASWMRCPNACGQKHALFDATPAG
jgi:hypothetical protein